MKFGRLSLADAEGAIVAHEVRRPGVTLRKGAVVDVRAVTALRASGIADIVAARLDPGDIDENAAAERIASRLAGAHVRIARASAGRSNLFARRAGVFVVDAAQVHLLNDVDEAITLATLAPWRRVAAGEMIATVKIIPFAVGARIFSRALEAAQPLLSVAPFRSRPVGVISTLAPGLKRAAIDNSVRNLSARLGVAGSRLVSCAETEHEAEALAAALRDMVLHCELIVVFGASAITDRRDVIPAAIERTGGRVESLGMPVDPGNLLLLGDVAGRP